MTRLWNDPFRVEVRGAKYIINRNGTGSQTPPTPLNRLQTNPQKAQCSTKVPPTGVQLIEFKFVGLVQTPFEAHHEEVELGLEKWCMVWGDAGKIGFCGWHLAPHQHSAKTIFSTQIQKKTYLSTPKGLIQFCKHSI